MMAKLTPGQIYNAARSAGFGPASAVVMTMISLAESNGGDPNAHCHNCFPGITEDSRGLWQINVDAHPDMAGWNLYDPKTNARAAYSVSSGGKNFTPWSTYTNGAYLSHSSEVYRSLGITAGAQPPASAPGGVPSGGAGLADSSSDGSSIQSAGLGVLNPLGLFGGLKSSVAQDVGKVAITGSFVLAGIALAVAGFWKGVQPTVQRVNDKIADTATTAAKVAAL
jgi:hypothetical protein